MFASVLLPMVEPAPTEEAESAPVLEMLTPVQRIQSGATSANPMLVGGGTPSGAEFVEALEYSPGVYAFGGSWNTSNSQALTFGSNTLSPTSPYGQEFYIAAVDSSGQFQYVKGANHNMQGNPGISIFKRHRCWHGR